MGEVVPARTSLTLHPPSTVLYYPVLKCPSASIIITIIIFLSATSKQWRLNTDYQSKYMTSVTQVLSIMKSLCKLSCNIAADWKVNVIRTLHLYN